MDLLDYIDGFTHSVKDTTHALDTLISDSKIIRELIRDGLNTDSVIKYMMQEHCDNERHIYFCLWVATGKQPTYPQPTK